MRSLVIERACCRRRTITSRHGDHITGCTLPDVGGKAWAGLHLFCVGAVQRRLRCMKGALITMHPPGGTTKPEKDPLQHEVVCTLDQSAACQSSRSTHPACLALQVCFLPASAPAAEDGSPRASKPVALLYRLVLPSTTLPPNPGLLPLLAARGETCHEKAAALWFGAGAIRRIDSTAASLQANGRRAKVIRAVAMV